MRSRLGRTLVRLDSSTPPGRERALDGLRALGVGGIVLGHWLVTALVLWGDGGLRISSPLRDLPQLAPLSWVLQTLALFFLVGGYVSTLALDRARERGESDRSWLLTRARRLGRPVVLVAAVWGAAAAALTAAGAPEATVRSLVLLVLQPLWFIGVYMAATLLTPLAVAAERRMGPCAAAALALPVAAVDLLLYGPWGALVPAWAGFASVLPAWLFAYLLGISWARGRLTRRLAWGLVAGGAAALAVLVLMLGYPASAVGLPGADRSNLNPPSLFVPALAAVQTGAAVLLRGPLERLGGRRRLGARGSGEPGGADRLLLAPDGRGPARTRRHVGRGARHRADLGPRRPRLGRRPARLASRVRAAPDGPLRGVPALRGPMAGVGRLAPLPGRRRRGRRRVRPGGGVPRLSGAGSPPPFSAARAPRRGAGSLAPGRRALPSASAPVRGGTATMSGRRGVGPQQRPATVGAPMIELPKRVHDHALRLTPRSLPACVHDLPAMTERARLLRACLPPAFDLYLPLPDPPPGAAGALAPHAAGFLVDTVPAMRTVLRECPGVRAVLAGTGKTPGELEAVAADAARGEAVVLADSPGELRLLEHCARRAGHPVGVLLAADPSTGDRADRPHGTAPGAPGVSWAGMDAAALVECAGLLGPDPAVRLLGFAAAPVDPHAQGLAPLEALRAWGSLLGIARPEYAFALSPDPSGACTPGAPGPPRTPGAPGAPGPADKRIAILAPPPGEAWSGWFLTPVLDVKHRCGSAYAVVDGGRAPDSPAFAVVPRDDAWSLPWERPELADEPVTVVFRGPGPAPAPFPPVPVDRLRPGDIVAFPAAPPHPASRAAGPQVHCLGDP
uniref:acyltransferase family protein n=1 Tax=Nocardiopsis chromatogenes TaxID=280239 RepID=UPI001EF9D1CC|nr:acyltransferase family protein [Nocardiopsis chromatogenes]